MESHRILVIDDNPSIHQDFRKILVGDESCGALEQMEALLFGEPLRQPGGRRFEVESALSGEEGVRRVRVAQEEGRPYALAFVDIRMPPGLDGVETTQRLWREAPDLQVVLCSAYSDYSWDELARALGPSQRLLILRKPFDNIEVRQMAHALVEKWELLCQNRRRLEDLGRELEAANERLMQARKLEALGRMSAGLAHEVNNPLSYVLSNLQHVENGLDALVSGEKAADAEGLRASCRDALTGAERIARIVQDVRLFARMEEPPRDWVDVRELVEHSLAMAGAALKPDIRLVRDFHAVPPVWACAHNLEQVFLNLLVNAAHALERVSAEPCIRVGLRQWEDGRVGVEVQDNGCGIPPQSLGRLFEPFFTTKPAGKGTGLGLSICHGIVTRHGGDITVDSAPGRGTTFRVLLVRAPAGVSLPPAPRRKLSA